MTARKQECKPPKIFWPDKCSSTARVVALRGRAQRVMARRRLWWWQQSARIRNDERGGMSIHGWSSVVHGLGPVHQRKLLGTNPCALETPTLAKGAVACQPSASNTTTSEDSKFLNLLMVSRDTGVYTNGTKPITKENISLWRHKKGAASGTGQQAAATSEIAHQATSAICKRQHRVASSICKQINQAMDRICKHLDQARDNIRKHRQQETDKMCKRQRQAAREMRRRQHDAASKMCKQRHQNTGTVCKRQHQHQAAVTAYERQRQAATGNSSTSGKCKMDATSSDIRQQASLNKTNSSSKAVNQMSRYQHQTTSEMHEQSQHQATREMHGQSNRAASKSSEQRRRKTSEIDKQPRIQQANTTSDKFRQQVRRHGTNKQNLAQRCSMNRIQRRVGIASEANKKQPDQQRQEQQKTMARSGKREVNEADGKRKERQIQRIKNCDTDKDGRIRARHVADLAENSATKEHRERQLRKRQRRAKSTAGNGKQNAKIVNDKQKEKQFQQARNAKTDYDEQKGKRQIAKLASSATRRAQFQQQQWRRRINCSSVRNRQQQRTKLSEQAMNARISGSEQEQCQQTIDLLNAKGRKQQKRHRRRAGEYGNRQQRKSEAEQQANLKTQKTSTSQIVHSATMGSKKMTQPAKVNKKRRGYPTKAIKQIRASTTRSTVRIRKGARSSTAPDGKAQKRYYHPIIGLHVALCAISLAKNLLSLVMDCEFSKWDADENDGMTSGTLTRLR